MNSRKITTNILLLLSMLCLSAYSQTGKLFNTENHLSSNFANQVFQDRNGFIWIVTRNGINVYDGYNFNIMQREYSEDKGLDNNYVNCISQDHNGNILLGTSNALLSYDGNRFSKIALYNSNGKEAVTYVTQILVRRNGDVLVATSGYGILKMAYSGNGSNKVCHKIQGALKNVNYILNMMEDDRGCLWITTESFKLLKLDSRGHLTQKFNGLDNIKVRCVQKDGKGNIYIASQQQGLFVMKRGSGCFRRIPVVANLQITALFINNSGEVYIGTDGNGIMVYNPATETVTQNPFFSNDIDLSKSKVSSIIQDTHGNIWMSMLQKGVFMQPASTYAFGYMGPRMGSMNTIGSNCVTSLLTCRDGNIWIGTDKDGAYLLNADRQLIRHYDNIPLTVIALCEDSHGRVWVGSYKQGCGYMENGQYHAVDLHCGSDFSVFDIKCDRYGNIWFATMGNGLIRFSANGNIKNYRMAHGSDNNRKVNSLPNDYLAKLALSHDGKRLYIATSIGLSCLDLKTDSWTSTFGLNCIGSGNFSHCVYEDSKGRVWYGTDKGAYCYDSKRNFKLRVYSIKDGLPGNSIVSMTEDANNRIWMGTSHGICCLNPNSGKIENYFADNGLQSNEFSEGTICRNSSGRLIMVGGTGGINWFDPLKMIQDKWHANVKISGFLIGSSRIPIDNIDNFSLAHDDNSFTIKLSTLTYSNVEQITYAYSINGEEWHTIQQGSNEIAFSHMPAGTYKFRVKAINNGQETPVKQFTVDISPVWYAGTVAKMFYFLLACFLIYLYMQYRRKKEHNKLLLQEHIHAEEMGEAKLRFFMNIGHEIRTPLTLIITPLLSLMKEDKDSHRNDIYEMMRKNSERILHLINQMMDLRKIDKGQMQMHMSETDMISFINDEHELFRQQAMAKNIDFTFCHDSGSLPVWIDRDNFDKVLMNILSNAFKFTPANGKITITLSNDGQNAIISVKDSGKGIPKDKLGTIFQRFYQAPSDPNDRNIGTGIGLDLTRSLVELHYGTITARDNEGEKGSEFIITLPLGNAHLKPEEMVCNDNKTAEEQDLEALTVSGPATIAEAQPDNSGVKARIAIVEDDESILEYLAKQLGSEFDICTYHNGKEALGEIIQLMPDLVISDIMMPEMDGNTLCRKIKQNINTNHIPVILLTAKSRDEDQVEGLETGADAYIVKPFNMDILHRTILNQLTVRRILKNKFSGNESMESKVEGVNLKSPDEKLLERIMEVINDNISDSDLSVDTIAEKVGVSRVHLHRKMKELTNQTPHNFIRNIRLKQAANLLKNSRQNVNEVVYACGFSNAASFSTMFKNLYGISPRDYARENEKPQKD